MFFPAGKLIRTDDGSFGVEDFAATYGTGEASTLKEPKLADDRRYLLAPGSPGVDAGVDVGLPFAGSAPDLGWKELGAEDTVPGIPDVLVMSDADEEVILLLWGKHGGAT